jgi:undecaprenyl-diphosphatase
MEFIQAGVLGLLQGLTEFLPVSSSGHLVLAHELFTGGTGAGDLAFDATLHFATALAVLVYFRREVVDLVYGAYGWTVGRNVPHQDKILIVALIVATAPAVALGLLLEDIMSTAFRNPLLVAAALIAGSLIMVFAERYLRGHIPKAEESLHWKGAFIVGCFQSLALVPGMSRSGMVIAGSMFMGLSREASARFAFLLAAPLLLGAGAKKMLELGAGEGVALAPLSLAALAAFASGIAVIHYLLRFLRSHSLMVFVWYRFLLAAFVMAVVLV